MPIRLVVSALLWPTMIAVSLLMLFPFGWQAAVANLLLDVTTESTPVGDWDVHLVEPTPSAALGATVPVLMHGVYENPRAHARVVSWIAERAAKVAEASAGRP